MNRQIKELAKEAGMIYGQGNLDNFDMLTHMPKEVRFAELIIAHATECVRDVLRDEDSDLSYWAATKVQNKIKQFFGVEE